MQHVLISSNPRSGGTWLGKLFDSNAHVRFLWEPDQKTFHHGKDEWTQWCFSDPCQLQVKVTAFRPHRRITPQFKKLVATHVVYKLSGPLAQTEHISARARTLQYQRFAQIVDTLDAQILHLVRHPARCVASAQRFGRWLHDYDTCQQWINDYSRESLCLWDQYQNNPRYKLILFEDLVQDTAELTASLMRWVGLDPENSDKVFWLHCHTPDVEEKDPDKHSVFMRKQSVIARWRNLQPWALDLANKCVVHSRFWSQFYKPLVR